MMHRSVIQQTFVKPLTYSSWQLAQAAQCRVKGKIEPSACLLQVHEVSKLVEKAFKEQRKVLLVASKAKVQCMTDVYS